MLKTTAKILGAILILGIGFMIIGMSFGKANTWFRGAEQSTSKERVSEVQREMEEFSVINAKSTISNIKIYGGSDEYSFEAQNMYGAKIDWEVKDGVLTISENLKPDFNFAKFNIYENQENYIIIFVPEKQKFENINIETASSDIVVNKVTGNSMELDLASGDLKIENSIIEDLSVSSASGDAEINNSQIKQNNYNLTSGDMSIKDVKSDTINGSFVSGDLEFKGEIENQADINSISGNVYLQIKGKEEDYSLDFRGISSYITVGDDEFEDKVNINKGNKLIKIENTSGNIGLRFI